nr:hypothetical protein GCM10020092_033950 [Actinoplanes digitatis]
MILRKAEIHAGVSAEAYFAVKAQARLMAAGSVLPTSRNNHRSGYAVEFQYGYAWVFGAGVVGNVDIEFPDAGDVLDALVREVLAQVAELIPAHQRTITTLLDIVLPLAASAAVALGAQLGVPKDTTDAAAARDELDGLIPAFLAQLRGSGLDLVMSTVVTAALGQAATAILAAVDRPLSPAGRTQPRPGCWVRLGRSWRASPALPSRSTCCRSSSTCVARWVS